MTEQKAQAIADAMGGETFQSGGNVWLVFLKGVNGHLVVMSEDLIDEYENEAAFENGDVLRGIELEVSNG